MVNKAHRCLRDNINISRTCERWSIEEEEKLLSNSTIYVNYKSNVKWKLIPYIW
jgi:hypothetical protein